VKFKEGDVYTITHGMHLFNKENYFFVDIKKSKTIHYNKDDTMTILDFTFAETTSNYVGPYKKVGQAAELRA
jgi:hypothetical protein